MIPEEIKKKAYERFPVKMGLWFDSHGIPEEIDLNEEARNAYASGMLDERERLMKEGDDELEKMIDDFEDWDGSYSRADLPTSYTTRDKARFFANWQRERMMKAAPVAEVIEMRENAPVTTEYPFMITLGFRKIPNMEYHGGAVRVIIEEIKEAGK